MQSSLRCFCASHTDASAGRGWLALLVRGRPEGNLPGDNAGDICGGCIGYAGGHAQYHAKCRDRRGGRLATRSRFWLLCVDIYAVLVAASIEWSTSGVAIFMVIWFIVLIPTIDRICSCSP